MRLLRRTNHSVQDDRRLPSPLNLISAEQLKDCANTMLLVSTSLIAISRVDQASLTLSIHLKDPIMRALFADISRIR